MVSLVRPDVPADAPENDRFLLAGACLPRGIRRSMYGGRAEAGKIEAFVAADQRNDVRCWMNDLAELSSESH